MDSKNFSLLTQFTNYCAEHTEERFWQALRNWSGYGFILGANYVPEDELSNIEVGTVRTWAEDTFYREDK